MGHPSGEQHEIEAAGYRAVVTGAGATLRHLSYDGRDLVQGFTVDEQCSGAHGQLLVPWPNRIRDGRYTFAGEDQQLPLSEPARHNASHGLTRWASWERVGGDAASVRLTTRVFAQPGYPWTLDVGVDYALSVDGLRVTMSATNLADSPAPFACGAHPYLTTGSPRVDTDVLTLAATTRVLTDDERKLPSGREAVAGTSYDLGGGRLIGDLVVDHAFTGLGRTDGIFTADLVGPSGAGVRLWADEAFGWVQVYTADDLGDRPRSALAVEPTTAPPDAFNSGDDLVVLAPGESFTGTWGLTAR